MEKFEIKETGEYWCADFDGVTIDADTIEFIYQNGIKYLEATITSMKSISDRSLILLSFLLGVIVYFVNIVKPHVVNKNFSVVVVVAILLIIYYGCIGFYIIIHFKPRRAYTTHTEPKELLQKEMLDGGLNNIKLFRCVEIQEAICINRKLMNQMFSRFERAVYCTLILPLVYKYIIWLFMFVSYFGVVFFLGLDGDDS